MDKHHKDRRLSVARILSGGAIHVRLDLCCRARQVVVTDAQCAGPDRLGAIVGAGQRLPPPAGHPLAPRVVAALARRSLPRPRADRPGLCRRQHAGVAPRRSGGTRGRRPVGLRALGPQALGTPAAASAPVHRHPRAAPRLPGQPHPRLGGLSSAQRGPWPPLPPPGVGS